MHFLKQSFFLANFYTFTCNEESVSLVISLSKYKYTRTHSLYKPNTQTKHQDNRICTWLDSFFWILFTLLFLLFVVTYTIRSICCIQYSAVGANNAFFLQVMHHHTHTQYTYRSPHKEEIVKSARLICPVNVFRRSVILSVRTYIHTCTW